MAIAFVRLRYVKRSAGRSAVAAAAYQARKQITDQRTGLVYDFRDREPIDKHLILLPENADRDTFGAAEALWNAAELIERRRNSQTAKEMLLALDPSLTLAQRVELVTSFLHKHVVSPGLAAQVDFHPPHEGDRACHCHVLITTRRIEGDRFATHKARDLDPVIRRTKFGPKVVEAEAWGRLWREHQEEYFQAHKLDLIVDPNSIYPLNRSFGPKRSWWHGEQETINLRQQLNAELAHHPDLVFESLKKTQQHFDGRAVDRFLTKHITEPNLRVDIKEKIEAIQRAAIKAAQKVQTLDEIIKQRSPIYADAMLRAGKLISAIESVSQERSEIGQYLGISKSSRDNRRQQFNPLRRALDSIGSSIASLSGLRDAALEGSEKSAKHFGREYVRLSIKRKAIRDQLTSIERLAREEFQKHRPEAERIQAQQQRNAARARFISIDSGPKNQPTQSQTYRNNFSPT